MTLFYKTQKGEDCDPLHRTLFHLSSSPRSLSPHYDLRQHLICCVAVIFSFACLVLLSIVLITEMSRAAFAARVADQVLRFHVIANSDSPEDQALKLEVRDALVAYMAQFNDSFDNAQEAAAFAADHCRELQQIAQTVIDQAGHPYTAQASVTTCHFPNKTYGDLTFPAGNYQALRVEIGQAKGQNWWCVLYPLLCFTEEGMVTVPEESQELLQGALSQKDYERLTADADNFCSALDNNDTASASRTQIRFRILDWLSSLFS